MATLNHLSPVHISNSSLRLFAAPSSTNTPNLSLNSQAGPFSLFLPSISLKPYTKPKPRASVIVLAVKTLAETELIVIPEDCDQVTGQFPPETGVYAVFDSNGDLQFVGLSRNVAASVLSHRKSVPELCHSVKVRTFFFTCNINFLGNNCLWFMLRMIGIVVYLFIFLWACSW